MDDFFVVGPDYSVRNALVLDSIKSELPYGFQSVFQIMEYKWSDNAPIACSVLEGCAWTDYVQSTLGVFVCQTTVLLILKDLKINSFSTTPIAVYLDSKSRKCGPPPTPLNWLRMPIGCGPLHQTGYLSFPKDGLRGVRFDLDTWTGLELFRSPKTDIIFVTRRIAMAFKEAGLTGMRITPALELE